MGGLFPKLKRGKPLFNIHLKVDDPMEGVDYSECTGDFKVMPDRCLVRGIQKGIEMYHGRVDGGSNHPMHVDFKRGLGTYYLIRKRGSFYLKEHSMKATEKTIRETVKWAQRIRT